MTNVNVFSIVPIEAFLDKRLTLEQLRVLGALFSFRAKNTDTVWPTRAQIAQRCGMHPSNISHATTELVKLGWLQKDGAGGFSKATRYRISVPETVACSATVAESTTVAYSATPTVAHSATTTVADSATRKEHNQEHTNRTDHFSHPNGCVSAPPKSGGAGPDDSPADVQQAKLPGKRIPPCPVQKIIADYNRILPQLPQALVRSERREALIRGRWRDVFEQGIAKDPEDGLQAFREFFEHVKESKFLTGKAQPRNGSAPFVADLEWLMRPTNFVKVVEGRYHHG
jgi:hypothetical protein